MASNEELKARMDRAGEIGDILERRLWVLAVITEFLRPTGLKPVLVGGSAVAFYTAGGYSTFDVDVVADSAILGSAMSELGFVKRGRHWLREELDISIEAPATALVHGPDRLLELEIDDMTAYIVGIEDLIIDRLNACVHWQSAEDGRWARHMMQMHTSGIDWDYVERRASQEGVSEELAAIRGELAERPQ